MSHIDENHDDDEATSEKQTGLINFPCFYFFFFLVLLSHQKTLYKRIGKLIKIVTHLLFLINIHSKYSDILISLNH